jgi:flagellar assembly protein FliH
MAQFTKFEFLTDFSAPQAQALEPLPEEESEAPPPTFSEDELRNAREHGYESGLAAGRAQALGDAEVKLCELMEGLNRHLDTLTADLAERRAMASGDVVHLARAIAGKVAGQRSTEQNLEIIESLVRESLAALYQTPEATVRIDPALVEMMRDRLAQADFPMDVMITGDERLQGSDCRVEWQDGQAERLDSVMWRKVDDILSRYALESPEERTVATPEENPIMSPADTPASGDEDG